MHTHWTQMADAWIRPFGIAGRKVLAIGVCIAQVRALR